MRKKRRTTKRSNPLIGRPRQPRTKTPRHQMSNTCYREERISVRMVDSQLPKRSWEPYQYGAFPRNPASNGLVRFRTSEKWFPGIPKRDYSVPFIDEWGHIHALSLGTWRCSPVQLFATICSTVYKRLRNITRTQYRKKRCNLDCLFKISLIYTITNDDSFFRRCLSMIQRMDRNIRKFVYYNLHKMDANRRFLVDQVRNCALWFQSRARKCRPRASSNPDNLQSPSPAPQDRRTGVLSTCNFDWTGWVSPFEARNRNGLKVMIDSTVGRLFKSSSSFRG